MASGLGEAVDQLDKRRFGALQYVEDAYVQQAFQDLPDGYVFDRDDLPPFKKKGAVTGSDIQQYLRDHYDEAAVPPARGLSQMLGALHEIGAVEQDGRHNNTRKYQVRDLEQETVDAVVAAVQERRTAQVDSVTDAAERVYQYIEDMVDDPFTVDDVRETVDDEDLTGRVDSSIGFLLKSGRLERRGSRYTTG